MINCISILSTNRKTFKDWLKCIRIHHKHTKLSNMILEIKPYHVDITMKQNLNSI